MNIMENNEAIVNQLEENIKIVQSLADQGKVDEALAAVRILRGQMPDFENRLLYEEAIMLFNNNRDRDALFSFIELYLRTKNREIFNLIWEAYISPNIDYYGKIYQHNIKLLEEYEYNYLSINLTVCNPIVWCDDSYVIYYERDMDMFQVYPIRYEEVEETHETALFMWEAMSLDVILNYETHNKMAWSIAGRKVPLYLGYVNTSVEAFLQTKEIDELLKSNRVVFFNDKEKMLSYFSRDGAVMPKRVIADGEGVQNYQRFFDEIETEKRKRYEYNRENVEKYYLENDNLIRDRIKNGNPRIMTMTTRFATAPNEVEFIRVAKECGLDTYILMEEDDLSDVNVFGLTQTLSDFRPDVLLWNNHFRWERKNFFPKNLVILTWIQDPMDNAMNPINVNKLTANDVLMNHLISYQRLLDIYKDRKMIDAPIPANENVYKPYVIAPDEKSALGADICFVCHQSDVQGYIRKMVNDQSGTVRKELIRDVCNTYFEEAKKGHFLFSSEDFYNFIMNFAGDKDFFSETEWESLVFDIRAYYNQRVVRQVLCDWLIEEGFHGIKLWGAGWEYDPKYEKYAMGWAPNGKTLSKILQSSKIVIGNNPITTGAARVWETLLSGGFYMSNFIPPESDWCDVRRILAENEEIIFFYNRDDLIKKTYFYLSNEEERKKMIEIGKAAALRKMTIKSLVGRVKTELPNILEKQLNAADV